MTESKAGEETASADNSEKSEKVKDEPLEELLEYIKEVDARIKYKTELRNQNTTCVRPQESYFSKLDSGLKKNTTFVKKLKSFSAAQVDALLKDLGSLNLTKYISEVASAITEAKLKLSDINAAMKLCSVLHQTYADFSPNMLENWQKILSLKVIDKIPNPSKLRVDLRFYAELVTVGVFTNKVGLSLLGNILTVLINMDKEEHNNISILLTFCKYCGEDYAGLIPKKYKDLSEIYGMTIPQNSFLLPEKQASVRSILFEYFASLTKHLVAEKQQLMAIHVANQRTLHTRGELSQERRDQLETHQATFDKLFAGAQNFAEVLGENLGEAGEPALNACASNMSEMNPDGSSPISEDINQNFMGELWQDEETRTFYTNLPDLKVLMPNYQQSKETVKKEQETVTEEMLDEEIKDDDLSDSEEAVNIPEPEQEEPPTTNTSSKYALEAFLNHLPNCLTKELIDNSAVDFIWNLNTKHNRKKLTRVLFSVARTRLDLLPFYARFGAILYPVLPDIGLELCQMLKQDFKYHVRKKDQINIESKIKVVRFIGELVKFALYPKIEALYCLKVLLHDFKHHHIEMACNLLETCGRYLYCSPDTHQRMSIYMQQMMRKKAVSALDSRHVTQIENAYYYVNPPESTAIIREEEIPLHQFIRKILHEDLHKSNEEKMLKLMRKLNWDDPEIAYVAINNLSASWQVRQGARRALARLVAGLSVWQEAVAPKVVDTVLEEIRATMEHPHPRLNQRRIATARYLGELYNYKLLDSRDIFNILYSFITFGVTLDHNVVSPIDPPDSVFRIRLVCALLETCGAYFNSGSSKKRLDYFLSFFQNYYWFKYSDPHWSDENPFPIYVKFIYQECLASLRPKLNQYKSWQACKDAIEQLRVTLYPEMEGGESEDISEEVDNEGLETIVETDDEGNSDNPDLSVTSDEEQNTDIEDMSEMDVKIAPRQPIEKQAEDLEFESELEKMVLDNQAERQRDGRATQRDISVPVSCRQQTKKTYEQLLQGKEGIEFVLMVRKGSKQQYKSFNAPSELASNLKHQAQADRLEMEKMKRLTLNISERQEEEEYNMETGGGGSGGSGNPNRGLHFRQKYQHPKGAPDADLIFGPKKLK